MTDPSALARLVETALDELGRIDAVVNNTGHPAKADLLDLTEDDWRSGFDMILLNVIRMAELVTPAMLFVILGDYFYRTLPDVIMLRGGSAPPTPEAGWWIQLARLMLLLLPFNKLAARLRGEHRSKTGDPEPELLERIGYAVNAAANTQPRRRLSWSAVRTCSRCHRVDTTRDADHFQKAALRRPAT